jgi:hypothetical protein
MAWRYLPDGGNYSKRAKPFDPQFPEQLAAGRAREVELRIGDDLSADSLQGRSANVTLSVQGDDLSDGLQVLMNDEPLKKVADRVGWIDFAVEPASVKLGLNHVSLRLADPSASPATLKDLQLAIDYETSADGSR